MEHPRNVYLAERDLVGPLNKWLCTCLAPHRVTETIEAMYQSQPDGEVDPAAVVAAVGPVGYQDYKPGRVVVVLAGGFLPVAPATEKLLLDRLHQARQGFTDSVNSSGLPSAP